MDVGRWCPTGHSAGRNPVHRAVGDDVPGVGAVCVATRLIGRGLCQRGVASTPGSAEETHDVDGLGVGRPYLPQHSPARAGVNQETVISDDI